MTLKDFISVLMDKAKLTLISLPTCSNVLTYVERSERNGFMAELVGVPNDWLLYSVVGVTSHGNDAFIVCIDRV